MTGPQFHSAAVAELIKQPDEPGRHALDHVQSTDVSLRDLFVKWYADRLYYCHAWRCWLVWDGRRWARDESGQIYRFVIDMSKRLYDAAFSHPGDEKERRRLSNIALKYQNHGRLEALVSLARSHESIVVGADQLDADPYALNCLNGTVDLRTGKLRKHSQADLITRLAPAKLDLNNRAPRFTGFLRKTFNGDADMLAYVRRAAGYSLTGDTSEQVLFITHGSGANGKSTLLRALQDTLGDYAATTPAETLMARRENGIPNDIARLASVRMVVSSESEEGRRLDEARIKQLTGGDKVTARFLRAEFFEFRPQFKLWLATNHRPEIRGTDTAIWRRIHLVPFSVTIPPEEQNLKLTEALRGELSGILAWAVQGALEWHERGLQPPEAVTGATQEYRSESDQLGRWIEERCEVADGFQGKGSLLYGDYKRWCADSGETPVTSTAFGRRLSERFQKRRTTSAIVYEGLGLKGAM